MGQGVSFYLLVWEFLGSKFINEHVLLLFTEYVKTTFHIFFDDLCADCCLLLELCVFDFLCVITCLAKGPQTSITEDDSKVHPNCLQEIFVIKSEDGVQKVIEGHTEHPDLLIVYKPAWKMIHSIFSKTSTKVILHLVETSIVDINDVGLLAFVIEI